MFSHFFIGVSNFQTAYEFYETLLPSLKFELKFADSSKPWAAWKQPDLDRPLLIIGYPFNGANHEAGNGQMIAFLAKSRSEVDSFYEVALLNGGSDEGGPKIRPQYHENYYGAYVRDPDGNKLCVCCHEPE